MQKHKQGALALFFLLLGAAVVVGHFFVEDHPEPNKYEIILAGGSLFVGAWLADKEGMKELGAWLARRVPFFHDHEGDNGE